MAMTMEIEPRKLPRQRRAQVTVEAILRATAQVLAEEGYAAASTNRVAQVAGVSVGSLYQYFPNKDALILAVAEEHSRVMREALIDTATKYRDGDFRAGVRHFVRGMIASHAIDPALHRALVQQLLHLGFDHFAASQAEVRALVEGWLIFRAADLQIENPRVAAFVLVATVESVIHAAVFEQPALLADPAFEDEVVRLVLRYVGAAAG